MIQIESLSQIQGLKGQHKKGPYNGSVNQQLPKKALDNKLNIFARGSYSGFGHTWS